MKLTSKTVTLPILFLFILIVIGASFFAILKMVKIKNIICKNQYGYCSSQMQEEIKKNGVGSLKNNILVSSFHKQFVFPDTIKVDVVIKKAKFAIKNKDNEDIALITEDGDCVLIVKSVSLPTLIIEGKIPNVGEKVGKEELFAAVLLEDMFYLYQVKTGNIQGDSVYFVTNGSKKVIFPLEGDTDVLIGSLRLIFSRLNMADKNLNISLVKEIDLRFKNPVLR